MRYLPPHANFATILVLALASLLQAGCTQLQAVKSDNMTSYALDAQLGPAIAATGNMTLLVNTPGAQPGFNTPRMVYIRRAHEIDYYTQHQWVGSPARMLAPLLVQALERTANYRAVIQASSSATAELRLDTEIVRLQHEFLTQPSRIHLTVRAQLLDIPARSVLASREFDLIETAPDDTPYGGVIASNRAVNKLLLQIADFCAETVNTKRTRNAAQP